MTINRIEKSEALLVKVIGKAQQFYTSQLN